MSLKKLMVLSFVLACFTVAAQSTEISVNSLATDSKSPSHDDVIASFNKMIKNNQDVRNALIQALAAMPVGTYWYNKKLPEVGGFFQQWLYNNPDVDNPLKMNMIFVELAYTEKGQDFVRLNPVASWLSSFFNAKGRYLDSKASTRGLSAWLSNKQVKISDYIIPKGGFTSFNEFFTRELRKNARSIDGRGDDNVVVSPNDGSMGVVIPAVQDTSKIVAKGDSLNIRKIFNGNPLAERFIGGPVIMSNLGAYNYHHFHSPVSGRILLAETFQGLYDSPTDDQHVSDADIVYQHAYEHRRGVYIIKNDRVGLVGVVPIGYWMISSVQLKLKEGDLVHKGDAIGKFAYGGSGILLFFEPNKVRIDDPYQSDINEPVILGQEIAESVSD
ncbi:phosphatidylserine decarboxylase [Dongshaea marina]|uniref:phosphatidylserine decarboxylase n=1 Tax=Dongshaea marina TaxID=2047966 RepID=UPI00131F2E18|nr:phosphatidylserine decarboxylase [Dongshaea marina]